MEKHRQKELLTTWECLNYKKSWQELTSCVITTRDSLILKMFSPIFCFEQEKALKKLSKKLCTSKIEKKKISWDEKKRLGLKNAKTGTNAQTFKWYETGMFFFWSSVRHSPTACVPLFYFYHILMSSVIYYWTDAWQHRICLLNI